jgi:hypothetical protein
MFAFGYCQLRELGTEEKEGTVTFPSPADNFGVGEEGWVWQEG